MYLYFAIFPKI